ncbi:MAG: hypothetical protein J7621_08745 [Niastella sp.]|nr:hypothetical protein [Niastella sp.]
MKKIYIVAASLLVLLAAACEKDDTTGATNPVPQLSVTGLKDTFNVFTYQDFLKITPTVQNDSEFDYYWTMFTTEFIPGQGLVKADTIGRAKDLNYEVLKDPGQYILVFNAKHKQTGVLKQVNMIVNVTTLTMNGWYLVKDNAGKTDMDFIHKTGRIDNWIANFNGKSLEGNFVKAVFAPSFRASLTSATYYNALAVATDKDMAIYRIDNGSMLMNFDNMFFTKPAIRKPQALLQPVANQYLIAINDGKAYSLTKGAPFATMPTNFNNVVYNNISPISGVGAMALCWSPVRKSMFCIDGATFVELRATNGGNRLQNMNADLKWIAGYAGARSVALALFRNPQDTGYLFKLNVQFGPLYSGSGALITTVDTLKPEHGLMHADVIGGNHDVDLIYYSIGDKIYMMDVASAAESLQFTIPAGEAVTAIQHIRYPQPIGNPAPAATQNYIVIATYKAGRYKVYKHPISGTGTISALPQADYEGEGRVSTVIYMEQGNGSRVF